MITSDDISRLDNISPAEVLDMPLASGDDVSESLWKNFINTRLRVDGDHIYLLTRGGSASRETFAAQILTIYPFATTINAVQKEYVAVHCSNGSAYLYDVGADTQTEIFSGVFNTTTQIECAANGLFLYLFDSTQEVYKYYNIDQSAGYDWLGNIGGSITSASWLTGKWTNEQSMWQMKAGQDVLMFHNFIEGFYTDPDTNAKTFRSFTTKIDSVFTTHFNYEDPEGKTYVSNENGSLVGFAPATPDVIRDYDRYAGLYEFDDQDDVVDNGQYKTPIIYKAYVVLDLLADGSYLTPGRPIMVESSVFDVNSNRRIGVELTLSTPPAGVIKRYLFASRWQTTSNNAFDPTNEIYPNSPYFLVKPVDTNQTTVQDYTPDDKLLEPLSSFIPLIAGVNQMFGKNQIIPNSIATAKQTLLIGGYRIERPVPQVYTDAVNAGEANIFWDQVAGGTNLTGDPELCLQFEYPDGKKSQIVATGHILTDAEDDEVIDPGQTAAKATTERWGAKNAPTGNGNAVIEYPFGDAGVETVTVAYTNTDAIEDVNTNIWNAINADPDIELTAEIYNAATEIQFTEQRDGADYNGNLVRITYAPDPDSPIYLTLSGGRSTITQEKKTGNRLQIHSLNALVSKVFVLGTDTDDVSVDYRVLREVEITESGAHGRTLHLPNTDGDFAAMPAYITPPPTDERESVDLQGFMVPSLPFQQPRINEQKSLEGSVRIGRLLPWRFAPDQTQLRFQVVVFTETNIQLGYLAFGEGGAFSLQADFEVILEGVRATSFDGISNVAGSIFFQSDKYVYMWSGGKPIPLYDVNRYEVSENNNPVDVIFNQDHYEVWIVYPSQDVIAVNLFDQSTRRMNFSNLGSIRAGGFYGDALYLGAGTELVETDLDSQDYDLLIGNVVEGIAQTRGLGTPNQKSKIIEVVVGGQGGTVGLDLDLQEERVEDNTATWPESFSSSVNYAEQTLYIHGATFQIKRRAIMPRLQITFKSGFIQYIQMRHVPTENRGIARKN